VAKNDALNDANIYARALSKKLFSPCILPH
jgi:hypothetical protein